MQDQHQHRQQLRHGASTLNFRTFHGAEGIAAVELRCEIYAADLVPDPDDGLDTRATHIAACDATGAVVAAFRVLGPELRPFDFEHIRSLEPLVSRGMRPAMIGRLCVRRDYRNVKRSTYVHAGLLAEAVHFASVESISDYFLYTFDYLRTFYRRGGFADAGTIVNHPHWGQLHLMHRSLDLPDTDTIEAAVGIKRSLDE